MKIYRAFVFLSLFIMLSYNCSLPAGDEEKGNLEGKDIITPELPWEGEMNKFTINSKEEIHLNDPQKDAGTVYATIPPTSVKDTCWEFEVHLTFNPSTNNYTRFYLTSSSGILSGNLNGYYIQIGGVKNNITLYRQNGDQSRLLASGRELMKGGSSPKLYIKIERDNYGYWTFWARLDSENEHVKERRMKDTNIQTSLCCGIYCIYTKTQCKGFIFHHIQLSNDVETDTTPDEAPDNPGTDIPDSPDTPELPEDVGGILLFDGIMYNNAIDDAEYIEIYSPAGQAIILPVLYLYKMYKNGTMHNTIILQSENPSIPLAISARAYLRLTKCFNRIVQKHKVGGENIIIIPNFPALDNNGGYLALSSSKETAPGHTFNTYYFRDEMHTSEKTTGVSLEKKSLGLSSLNKNWHSSEYATGGTPGIENT